MVVVVEGGELGQRQDRVVGLEGWGGSCLMSFVLVGGWGVDRSGICMVGGWGGVRFRGGGRGAGSCQIGVSGGGSRLQVKGQFTITPLL